MQVGSDQDIAEPLRPGRNYSYQLTFINPLYETISVQLDQLDPADLDVDEEEDTEKPGAEREGAVKRLRAAQHFQVVLPGTNFDIDQYAEAWEYEAAIEDEDDGSAGGDRRKKRYGPGILEKRANRTVVQLDLTVGRDAVGPIKVI